MVLDGIVFDIFSVFAVVDGIVGVTNDDEVGPLLFVVFKSVVGNELIGAGLLFVAQRGDGGTDGPNEGGLFRVLLFGIVVLFVVDTGGNGDGCNNPSIGTIV